MLPGRRAAPVSYTHLDVYKRQGQDAIIRVVGGEGELRHHLLDMGLTPGTEVTLRKTAPMGDPLSLIHI